MSLLPAEPLVAIYTSGHAGRITLQKPKALNALEPAMTQAIEAALIDWENDPQIAVIIIDAQGDRAFCAGGDIASIYHSAKAQDYDFAINFWRQEYRMNLRLSRYSKPVVSLMQGFILGGGVGLGCHVSHRVLAKDAQVAMPECSIGLVPDVGGTHLLAKAPGYLGEYLALTSSRMGMADALYAGFADYHVPQSLWPELIERLCQNGDVSAIAELSLAPPPAPLSQQAAQINALFSADSVVEIQNRLKADDSDFARAAHTSIARNAPLSLNCTFALIRQARQSDDGLAGALRREFRYCARILPQGDFVEGIRAQIIEKDRKPIWRHSDLALVSMEEVRATLADLGPKDLDLGGIP